MTAAEHAPDFELTKDTPTATSRVSYGVSIVRILENIDHVITALHCTSNSEMTANIDIFEFSLNFQQAKD